MTRDEGHALLNRMREGQTFAYEEITAALVATGDLAGWREPEVVGSLAAGMRSQGLDQAVQRETAPGGGQQSDCLVERNDQSNRTHTRQGGSRLVAGRYE